MVFPLAQMACLLFRNQQKSRYKKIMLKLHDLSYWLTHQGGVYFPLADQKSELANSD